MSESENPVDPSPEGTSPGSEPQAVVVETTIRRAPKLGAFLVVGGLFGMLATLVLTSLFPADPNVGFTASFGYFLLYGIPFGVLVGAVIGLALDRRSRRRTRTVTVEHDHVD